jgi:predicted dehydrogenase
MSAFPGGHQEGYGDTFKYIIRSFYSDLLGLDQTEAGDYPTLADGTSEMLLCEAIIQSVEAGDWIRVKRAREVQV